MKKITIGTILSLLVMFTLVTAVFADTSALPGSGWWSGEQIQNVGSSTATVNVVAYAPPPSSTTYSTSVSLAKGTSTTIFPWTLSLPSGFQGSAIVSSSADIRAIVNVTVKYNAGRGVGDPAATSPASGQYQGVVIPGTTLYFPLVKNNHFTKTTSFAIQNAGSAAATATATFKLPNGPGGAMTDYPFTTPSIGPGQMVIISPSDAGAPSGDGEVGSLVVTSAQPLAGTAMEYITNEVHASVLQATRAFTSSDFYTTYYAPIIKRGWGNRNTGIQAQNVSGGTVDINVTYTGSQGDCAGITYTDSATGVANGASATFLSTAKLPTNCLATAQITSSGNIIAIVNESYNPIPAGSVQEATSYNAFPGNSATTIISIPLYKENSSGKATGIAIQNVGTSAATNVVVKFIGPAGTFISQPLPSIAAGASAVILNARLNPPSFWNGTAMTPAALGCAVPDTSTGCGGNGVMGVIITSDKSIVAIANEATTGNWFHQDKQNYEGFNLTTDPTAP